ncbi:hypothetical protein LCY76_23815 [Fictibacillus sp. KIGAM418]|uniref:Uncharacterized protein n=1 Tax=Fictibacillus marinisediminis TaxID=2878389 RepID=A0A9X1XH44_9BACL|nr:hypothetical protein [Fictibacillus marinisediminis]MCK6259598.1 hypothetical protein [Fictibacillus marinisediminis]
MEFTTFFKWLDEIIYILAIIGGCVAGYFIYSGLSTREERIRYRMRIRQGVVKQKEKYILDASNSLEEQLLKQAGHPLKINGLRYRVIRILTLVIIAINYTILPFFSTGSFNIASLLIVLAFFVLTEPKLKFSLFSIILNKVIEYRQAKRNSEIFQLHDLLISEIDMMTNNRVNTYNILKNLYPYFTSIKGEFTRILMNWKNDPDEALEVFSKEIDTKEAKALVSVLKKLDDNEQSVAIEALRSHADLFAKSQIENYRRRKKLFLDIGGIPIRAAHFFIILNFLSIVVYMVLNIFSTTRSL